MVIKSIEIKRNGIIFNDIQNIKNEILTNIYLNSISLVIFVRIWISETIHSRYVIYVYT